jgi:hypothetical protein
VTLREPAREFDERNEMLYFMLGLISFSRSIVDRLSKDLGSPADDVQDAAGKPVEMREILR